VRRNDRITHDDKHRRHDARSGTLDHGSQASKYTRISYAHTCTPASHAHMNTHQQHIGTKTRTYTLTQCHDKRICEACLHGPSPSTHSPLHSPHTERTVHVPRPCDDDGPCPQQVPPPHGALGPGRVAAKQLWVGQEQGPLHPLHQVGHGVRCQGTGLHVAQGASRRSKVGKQCARNARASKYSLGARFGTRDSGGVVSLSCCDGLVYLLGYTGSV
jgi:hypothetical protein